jgi:hypothetical protein
VNGIAPDRARHNTYLRLGSNRRIPSGRPGPRRSGRRACACLEPRRAGQAQLGRVGTPTGMDTDLHGRDLQCGSHALDLRPAPTGRVSSKPVTSCSCAGAGRCPSVRWQAAGPRILRAAPARAQGQSTSRIEEPREQASAPGDSSFSWQTRGREVLMAYQRSGAYPRRRDLKPAGRGATEISTRPAQPPNGSPRSGGRRCRRRM